MNKTEWYKHFSELEKIQDQWEYIILFKSDMSRDEYEAICMDVAEKTRKILEEMKK